MPREHKCPKCGNAKVRKIGFCFREGKKIQRYQCTLCGKTWSYRRERENNGSEKE